MMATCQIVLPLLACLAGEGCALAIGSTGVWRRMSTVVLGWIAGLFPVIAFGVLLWIWYGAGSAGEPIGVSGPAVSGPWIESLGAAGLSLTLRLDGL